MRALIRSGLGPTAAFGGMLIGVALLRSGYLAAGWSVIAAAGVCFALLSAYAERHPPEGEVLPISVVGPASLWLTAAGISLAVGISLLADWRSAAQDRANAEMWLGALALAVAGTIWMSRPQRPTREQVRDWLRAHGREALAVTALTLTAFALRRVDLLQHPYPWSGDEASIGIEARRILTGMVTNLFTTGWSGQPNWSFVPDALLFRLVGDGIFAIRLVSALTGSLTVLTLYLFAHEAFGARAAWLAAAFLLAYPYHLQFSRVGVHNVMDGLASTLTLWLIVRAARTGRATTYGLAGLATGLTLYTYVGTRLVLGLALAALVLFAVLQRGYLRAQWKAIGMFFAGWLVAAAPLVMYFAKFPQLFMTRISQESILLNDWLPQQVQRTGESVAQILLDQARRSVMVFIADSAPGNFYNSPQSYLTLLGSILLLLGMVYCLSRLRSPHHALLLIWFWAVVVLGSMLTLNPPANTRMVMTAPAVALLIALGLEQSLQLMQRLKLINHRWAVGLSVAAMVALLAQNLTFYFVDYRRDFLFQDANGELAMELGLQVQRLGPTYDLYLIGYPRVFVSFPTLPYLVPRNERRDLLPEEVPGFTLPAGRPALLAATPENRIWLEQIANHHPGGEWYQVQRVVRPEVLYYAYRLGP